jgi:hypothetical protein
MRELGMPIRTSVKNPVDIGASGLFSTSSPCDRMTEKELDTMPKGKMILYCGDTALREAGSYLAARLMRPSLRRS